MKLTAEAQAQLNSLFAHYGELDRSEAIRNLQSAMRQAKVEITKTPRAGLRFPRPYPELSALGHLWVKVGSYWISYRHGVGKPGSTALITGIYYDRSNIPGLA